MTRPSASIADQLWRVVIIDDSAEDRAEARRLLLLGSERRYRFVEAETAAAGLRAVREAAEGPPDCVLLDVHLPDADAHEVLAALRGPSGPDADLPCPVVVMTGSGDPSLGRRVLHAGAQDFVGKGWMTPESLTRTVENAVERLTLTRRMRERDAAVRESEARLRLTLEASNTGLWTWDLRAGAVVWSPETYALLGVAEGAFDGRAESFFRLVHPDDRARVEATVGRAIADRTLYECDFRIVRPDGQVAWVQNRGRASYGAAGEPLRVLGTVTDVTDRRRAEEALRASEERLVRAQRAAQVGTWEWNVVTGESNWTAEAWRVFYGRPPTGEPVTYDLWLGSIHPDDRARAAAKTAEALRSGTYDDLFRVVHPGGAVRWIEARGEAEFGPDGQPLRLLGTARDVTEAHLAEEARRRAQALTQAIIDGSDALIFAKGLDGQYFLTNRAWREFAGLTPEAVLGANDEGTFGPGAAEGLAESDRRVVETAAPLAIEENVVVRGEPKTYFSNKFPLLDREGRAYAIGGVSTDVTELKRAQAAMLDRERDLRSLADNSPDILSRFDRELRHVFVNAAVTRATGLTPEHFIGKTNRELGMPADLCDLWEGALRHVFATGEATSIDFTFPSPGSDRYYASRLVPEYGPGGAIERVLSVAHDVTERRRAEDALKEADRRKDEFLATLAHELRNPLAPIRTGLELMKAAPNGDPGARQSLAIMERQLGHLVRLVDDLLDVSRISRGKVELKRARVRLGDVFDHATEASRALIATAGHVLTVRAPPEPLWVDGDLTRLIQSVGNLLNNAAKYTPDGGHIELWARAEGGEAIVGVTDDGAGISAEMLPRVFDLFTQVDQTLNRARGGLGIGLSLVRKLVELHGGTVEAQSDGLGRGSTFRIRLPLAAARSAEASAGATHRPPSLRPRVRRILVVDDNVDAAELLAAVLKLTGHQTRTAHDGYEALATAEDFRPDAIFLDIGLPGIDGYEVAKRLRAAPGFGAMLVALTGWGAEDDKRHAKEAGFDFHLTKPVERAQIEDLLERLATRPGAVSGEATAGGA
jgi:PAS domain S-box-containing protein